MDRDGTRREAVRRVAPAAARVVTTMVGGFSLLIALILLVATASGESLPVAPVVYRAGAAFGIVLGVAVLRMDMITLLKRRRGLLVVDAYVVTVVAAAVGVTIAYGRFPVAAAATLAVMVLAGFLARPSAIAVCVVLITVGEAATLVRSADPSWSLAVATVGLAVLVAAVTRQVATSYLRVTIGLVEALALAERRNEQVGVVADAARDIHVLDTDAMLQAVVDATEALGWDVCAIYAPPPAGGEFLLVGGRGTDVSGFTVPREGGVLAEVLETGAMVVRREYQGQPGSNPLHPDIRVAAGVPLIVEAAPVGALVVGSRDPQVAASDLALVELLAAQAGRAMETLRSFEFQRQAMAEVERASRLKDDFVATVSHEVRTPVQVVLGMAETLDERWDALTPDMRVTMVQRLRRNAVDMQGLVEALLDFSRLAGGALPVRPAPVDLVNVAEPIVRRVRPLYPEHVIQRPDDSAIDRPSVVVADAVLIARVVENLVVNACRHTPVGTTVGITITQEDAGLRLTVADDGPGIAAAELERLGERFYRGESSHLRRETRGVGLGLAFCVEILARHDTTLTIASEQGHGARFSFVLPAAARGAVTAGSLPADLQP